MCIYKFFILSCKIFDIFYSDHLITSKNTSDGAIDDLIHTTDPGSLLFHSVVGYMDQEGI